MMNYMINRYFHLNMSHNFRYIINIIFYCLKSNHPDIIYIDLPFPFPYNQNNPIDTVYKSNFINNN